MVKFKKASRPLSEYVTKASKSPVVVYKAIIIDRNNYLLEVSRYVNLNPIRVLPQRQKNIQAQRRYLENYPWSSLAATSTLKRNNPGSPMMPSWTRSVQAAKHIESF